MSSSNALEEQILALVCQLEETREGERQEEAHREAKHKEVEAVVERACEAEQHRLQEEAEARLKHEWRNAEEHCVEQEPCEEEEEEARRCRSRLESTLTPVVAPEMELPWRKGKGKGPELAPESEVGQESRRCDSCERQDVECVRIKVSGFYLKILITDSLVDR